MTSVCWLSVGFLLSSSGKSDSGNLFIFGKKYLIAALAFFLGFLGSFSWDARVLEDNPLHLRSFISFEDFLVSRIPFAVPRLHFITGLLFIFTARLPSVAILVFFGNYL